MNEINTFDNASRIQIFVGEFGSGKTELAINYAICLAMQNRKTAIVDIDLVKPYFRTRESRKLLEKNGVIVVAPDQNLSHSDLPIMPRDLTRTLYDSECRVVIDAGGGDSAISLGQINNQLIENSYEAILVVNTCRPFTSNADDIVGVIQRIEKLSRLKISKLVSNTNLAGETTVEHILSGLNVLENVSSRLDLPIKWVVVPEWIKENISLNYPIFYLKPYTLYPWMD